MKFIQTQMVIVILNAARGYQVINITITITITNINSFLNLLSTITMT